VSLFDCLWDEKNIRDYLVLLLYFMLNQREKDASQFIYFKKTNQTKPTKAILI